MGGERFRESQWADELSQVLADTPLDNLGVRTGASLAVTLADGRSGLLRIDGDILGCVERAAPLDATALDL
ncbi:MAG TPA: hypothetical protein VFQ44_16175 [Streptosporangiaceae bacterium]|nr:hypothetical protein [Streptosporangiaceae bacterium]